MNELAVPVVFGVDEVARAKPKDVRAPKNRSIVRPVVWSTKGVERVEAEDVASCAVVNVVKRHARNATKSISYILIDLVVDSHDRDSMTDEIEADNKILGIFVIYAR